MKTHKPFIYLISDGLLTPQNYSQLKNKTLENFAQAIDSGVTMIQIREKNLTVRQLFDLTSETVKLKGKSATKILVNDRADVAIAAQANGVHLTTNSVKTTIIHQNFPANFIIGVSTHSSDEIKLAQQEGADFVVFSPIFPTASKEKYGQPQGIDKLKEVVNEAKDFPIVALGGININNFREVLETEASGIAGISLFNQTENLAKTINEIREFYKKNG